jgi:hypothetical protein
MRLEPGVDAGLVDFDHEVAVIDPTAPTQYGMGFTRGVAPSILSSLPP